MFFFKLSYNETEVMTLYFSTLYKISSNDLGSEAEVEVRFLAKLFNDLGYTKTKIVPKSRIKSLQINDGSKKTKTEVDFLLLDSKDVPRVIVEAKDPKINVMDAWGQAASYALSYNRDKEEKDRIKWLLISNGHITALFKHDSSSPVVMLTLTDFASGSPPYVILRSHIKYDSLEYKTVTGAKFETIPPDKLNQLFYKAHDMVWKKEKLNPTDAFFEFVKFIFIKIRLDKERERLDKSTPENTIPLTEKWLEVQSLTSAHPVRDILFRNLHEELEYAIKKERKRRIFDENETLRLSASTCKELIKIFQAVNLSAIDEDLNGRMFEVFLNAAIRGKALGQYFTPRPVVDFMTRISLRNISAKDYPKILDGCCGTAGFLIEAMAYLISGLREDTRFNEAQKLEIKDTICNECLFGIDANERVARIARINMYLHGDGGSHIFHGDGLDIDPQIEKDMNSEKKEEIRLLKEKITESSFDIILSNPPFSMSYSTSNEDEKRILKQHELTLTSSSAKSSLLFLNRYQEILKPGGEMLIVLDDTVLNGKSFQEVREWIREKFVILSIHSLPFNAFFKAQANIKTSILHLRKKKDVNDQQGHVFMSITNNVGHNNSLKDTPDKNNLNEILVAYLEWQRTGIINCQIKENEDKNENLECPQQYWLLEAEKINNERFDAFFYSPELNKYWDTLELLEKKGKIKVIKGIKLPQIAKITSTQKKAMIDSEELYKYIEIGDVNNFGLINSFLIDTFDKLPTRGQYKVQYGDILVAINNSSRGTVVLVPEEFDGTICTSGFKVIRPKSIEESYLLWYSLRSEVCRAQIYYLAQTASQPEIKSDTFNKYFRIPIPIGVERDEAIQKAKDFFNYINELSKADKYRFTL